MVPVYGPWGQKTGPDWTSKHYKAQCRLPVVELQPLAIPEERWDTISIDFISELPESGGYDAVMVAVDTVGKRSHFTETVTTVTAAGATNLYLCNVWKLYGLPHKVVSDRGLQFVAAFMKELYWLLRIEAVLYGPPVNPGGLTGILIMTRTESGLTQDSLRTHIQDYSELAQNSNSGLAQDSHSGLDQDWIRTHIQDWLRTGSGLTFRTQSGLAQDSHSGLNQDWLRTHIQDQVRTGSGLTFRTKSGLALIPNDVYHRVIHHESLKVHSDNYQMHNAKVQIKN